MKKNLIKGINKMMLNEISLIDNRSTTIRE
jgi:hypothetical protein